MDSSGWLRTSWVAVIYHIVTTLTRIARDAWYSLIPIFAFTKSGDSRSSFLFYLLSISALTTIIIALLKYLNFGYRLTESGISIRSGVLQRKSTHIDFARIQNINIKQSFYFKPLKVATLLIETAGSSNEEGAIVGIGKTKAENLRRRLLKAKAALEPVDFEDSSKDYDDQSYETNQSEHLLINGISVKDRFLHGVASNAWLVGLVALLPLMNGLDDLVRLPETQRWLENLSSTWATNAGFYKLLAILIATLSFFLLPALSGFSSIFRLANFKISTEGSEITRTNGFFSTQQETLKPSKIQAVVITTNLINRLLKREVLHFDQISTATQSEIAGRGLFSVPARLHGKSIEVYQAILPSYPEPNLDFKMHPRFILVSGLIAVISYGLPIGLLYFFVGPWAFMLALLVSVSATIKAWLRYRNTAFGFDSEFSSYRKGILKHTIFVFPHHKIQWIGLTQSLLQKRRNLCTLTIATAARTISIPYLDFNYAKSWRTAISSEINRLPHDCWY